MPANVKDEGKWEKAKKEAKKSYPDIDTDSDRFYKITNRIYQNMGGEFTSKKAAIPGKIIYSMALEKAAFAIHVDIEQLKAAEQEKKYEKGDQLKREKVRAGAGHGKEEAEKKKKNYGKGLLNRIHGKEA